MKKITILGKTLVIVFLGGFIFLLSRGFETDYHLTEVPATKKPPKIPVVTIDSIFGTQNDVSELDKEKLITIVATGDVIPARGANWPAVTKGDFTYNWRKVASTLKKADIALINLESPLTKGCPLMTEGMTFCGDARHIQGITYAGIDSASLANNHIGNFGKSGIDETISLLKSKKVGWSGFGNLDIQKRRGITFGFLSYNGISTSFDRQTIATEIKQMKQKVDVLVVSAHWGDEYVLTPRKYGNIAPDDPKEIAHLMIDAGTDLIIGNHPHTVQGVEIYKNKLITYAHGNFIFDQTWSQETQEGVVGEYVFYEEKLVNVKFYPILVDESYQPRFLGSESGKPIIDRMLKSSKLIAAENN